jgi:hypothetical protein
LGEKNINTYSPIAGVLTTGAGFFGCVFIFNGDVGPPPLVCLLS